MAESEAGVRESGMRVGGGGRGLLKGGAERFYHEPK